jgi:hypothetical protein
VKPRSRFGEISGNDGAKYALGTNLIICSLSLQPLLEHHRNPDHLAVVAWMLLEMLAENILSKLTTNYSPIDQPEDRVPGQKA